MHRSDDEWPGLPAEDEPPALTTFEFLTLTRQAPPPGAAPAAASPRFSVQDVLTVLKIASILIGWTGANLESIARSVVVQLYGDSGP